MQVRRFKNGEAVYEREKQSDAEPCAYLVLLGSAFLYTGRDGNCDGSQTTPTIADLEAENRATLPTMKKVDAGEIFGVDDGKRQEIGAVAYNSNLYQQEITVLLELTREAHELIISQNAKHSVGKITRFFQENIPKMRQVYTSFYLANRKKLLHCSTFSRNQVILAQGSPSAQLFLVLEGEVTLKQLIKVSHAELK